MMSSCKLSSVCAFVAARILAWKNARAMQRDPAGLWFHHEVNTARIKVAGGVCGLIEAASKGNNNYAHV